MSQPRKHSLLESLVNLLVGFILSIILQYILFPFYEIPVNFNMAFEISLAFTVLSLIRSYVIRRIFNKLH